MAEDRVERVDEDPLRLGLADVDSDPMLSEADEVRLAKVIQAGKDARVEMDGDLTLTASKRGELARSVRGGQHAERQLVQSNLGLVVSVAERYQASGLPLRDLVQAGNLGLIRAVEKFDWRKGSRFSEHAKWWIRQAITRGIAQTVCTIRLPDRRNDPID